MRSIDTEIPAGARRAAPTLRIVVWDVPTRVFHWLMVLCFTGAFLTAESDALRPVHVTLGYTMGGLLAFRLVWGLIGPRHARFASFVRGPRAVMHYVRSLVAGRPERHVGHNPAGAVAIVALLAGTVLLVASGWATYRLGAGEWVEELHEIVANLMLALVVVHVLGVLASSWLHRENLVGAMLHGHKSGAARDGIGKPRRLLAALLLALVAGFWWYQWQTPAQEPEGRAVPSAQHDDD